MKHIPEQNKSFLHASRPCAGNVWLMQLFQNLRTYLPDKLAHHRNCQCQGRQEKSLQRLLGYDRKYLELDTEESINTVQEYIKASYPDFRKTLNVLQQNVINGKLVHMEDSIESSATYRTEIVEALKNGTIRAMREKIVQSIPEDEMDAFFSYLYRNAEMFSTDPVTLMKIKVKIRDAVVKQATVSDREMNLSALLCEIDLICSGNM